MVLSVRARSVAFATRCPDTSAPWIELVSRWSPAIQTPLSGNQTGLRNWSGAGIAGSACRIVRVVTCSHGESGASCTRRASASAASALRTGWESAWNTEVAIRARPSVLYSGAVAVRMTLFARPVRSAVTVRWVASDEAAYITGAVIPVDGGIGMGH